MADKKGTERGTERESGLAVQEARPKLKKPPLYKVVMLNDDYTPMEFVVHVLETFFSLDRNAATRIMLDPPQRGTCRGADQYQVHGHFRSSAAFDTVARTH